MTTRDVENIRVNHCWTVRAIELKDHNNNDICKWSGGSLSEWDEQ